MRKIIDLSYNITITIVLSRVTNKERWSLCRNTGDCCRGQIPLERERERLRLQDHTYFLHEPP